MNLLCAKDVIGVARDRGFKVIVKPGPPPMPVLFCPKGADKNLATPALLEALRAWRLDIIDELTRSECETEVAGSERPAAAQPDK